MKRFIICITMEIALTLVISYTCIYFVYFGTGIGLLNGYLFITGIPIQLASFLMCIIIPFVFLCTIDDVFKKRFYFDEIY